MNLGNKIRELRKANNLTQEQLAAALSVSPQAVSKWEMGASFPDMTMVPVLAGFFKVSLDALFDFDLTNIDREIEDIRKEHSKYFWTNYEKAEQILLDGLKLYPASIQLKTDLFELYAYNADRGDEHIRKAFELAGQIIHISQDIFCTCRTKSNMIHIYTYLQNEKHEDHYEDIKSIVQSLPYMYPYMIQDRMRLAADHLKGEEGMAEAMALKRIEWQEFFHACYIVARRYFEQEDYENALVSFQEVVDVIERFMLPCKHGYDAYPIGGTYANHAIHMLDIAACHLHLGNTEKLDALIEKAKTIYFDAYEGLDDVTDAYYCKEMREMMDYFTKEYHNRKLHTYKALDLSYVQKRINARRPQN